MTILPASARGRECQHIWYKTCEDLYGSGVHYICSQCGHSNTYLRLRITEEEALASVPRNQEIQLPFPVSEEGWAGKWKAGGTIVLDPGELEVLGFIGHPGKLNWGRIPPEGFPSTFTCERTLFWSESENEAWKGSILSGEIWIDDPSFLLDQTKGISHFAVFNTPRRTDDHQNATEE